MKRKNGLEAVMSRLTKREREVVERMKLGRSRKQVANDLGTSPHTVHNQISDIYKRLAVQSTGELLALFYI